MEILHLVVTVLTKHSFSGEGLHDSPTTKAPLLKPVPFRPQQEIAKLPLLVASSCLT